MYTGLLPSFELVEELSRQRPTASFASVLQYLCQYANLDKYYFICDISDVVTVAEIIDKFVNIHTLL